MVQKDQETLHGRTALVLGASGPIGRAVGTNLAQRGSNLILHGGHDTASLTGMAQQFEQEFSVATQVLVSAPPDPLDLANLKCFREEPDIVILCWGPWLQASLATTSAEQWKMLTLANLALPGAIVSTCAPYMARNGYGRLLFFGASSSDRIQSYTSIAAYAAAKTGLGVLAKSAAREFGASGVTCNILLPGFHGSTSDTSAGSSNSGYSLRGAMPTDSIGALAGFLCTMQGGAVNGAIISAGYGL